jgi:D-alanyl-D-alanine carboxypeptidase
MNPRSPDYFYPVKTIQMKSLKIYLLISVSSITAFLNAQTVDPALAAALQSSINTLRTSYQLEGISAAAFIPGQGTWQGVTGYSYDTIPIDSTMLFCIGSITKTFVASEIFKLVENHQLSLDDSLHSLLPAMNNVNPDITVRQLLGHRSGMADYLNPAWENSMFSNPFRTWYTPEVLDSFLTAPLGPPGSPWNYINANYALLGMIVEAQNSDSLHSVLRNNFLTPLGLNKVFMETFETYTDSIPHNWAAANLNPALAQDVSATPHEALWSSIEAAGGYFAKASDLAAWGYNLYSGNVISDSSLAEMTTFIPVSGGYFNGYGLGSMRFPYLSRTYWGHAGNFFGYAACLLYYPQDSVCVAVLINQDCIAANVAKPLMNIIVNHLGTGIADYENRNTISVYPNPVNSSLTISLPAQNENCTIELFGLAGNLIQKQNATGTATTLSTAALSNGTYLLRVSSSSGVSTQKIIVCH